MARWRLELGNILPLAIYLDGLKGCMLWSKGMYREHVRRMIGHLKRALRMQHRLTVEEFYQLLQLSEAIIDYGRMIQAYRRYSAPNVILEITELANRFRETPQTIKDALLLIRDIGCAEPADLDGCWKLRVADASSQRLQGFSLGDAPVPGLDDDTSDLGTA